MNIIINIMTWYFPTKISWYLSWYISLIYITDIFVQACIVKTAVVGGGISFPWRIARHFLSSRMPRFTCYDHRQITLHFEFKAKKSQTLYRHYNNLEAKETTPRINEILVWFWRFAGNLTTSLRLVMFHVRATATGNARSPTVESRVELLESNAEDDDDRRRCWTGILATGWMASAKVGRSKSRRSGERYGQGAPGLGALGILPRDEAPCTTHGQNRVKNPTPRIGQSWGAEVGA